ncbi:dihydrolipoyllysine-residue acetyltransferase [Marinobacter changyiensis]|uniref:dihydrolipoyllysine-residue acetyltransferase n=1 Tax=Marinobacter changyiensis TaxID=2604091 RepID=UPI0012642E52|nr:dihydrolipoyllysine-residue acetyltransferase [Marinobacter changyiensis]
MSEQEIKVPDLGGADEVEVIEITVSKGDSVAEEDPILTVESDKASVELPSPSAGKITKITVKVGDKVKEGDVVGMMEVESGAQTGDESGGSDESQNDADEKPEKPEPEKAEASESKSDDAESKPKKASSGGGARKEKVQVPDMGGSEDVPIIEINVKEGDEVAEDDPLVTVESDKATMEIPSPFAGKIGKILVSEGDKISQGDDLLEMQVTGGESGEDVSDTDEKPEAPASQESSTSAPKQEKQPAKEERQAAPEPELPPAGTKVHAGPAVRKLARELGADLTRIKGSGPKSRIVKDDIHAYVKQQLHRTQEAGAGGGAVTGGSGIPGIKLPDFSQFGDIQRESMSRMQVATANNMARSWLNVPHVTQFDDADITEMENFRKAQKAAGEKRGSKLTPLPFLLKACARALAELPQFNVALDMEKKEIVHKNYIHIGVAVDTPAGLMVPVIRNVDQKGLWELADEAMELAGKARDKKLKPNEMQGACFSITSLGGIGGTAFTPIVNAPEIAILGVSKAAMKPVWDGKEFQPRLILPLSLSYDHRAVNGADAARFTALLSELLGDIRHLLL